MKNESLKSQTVRGVKWTALETFGVRGSQFIISLVLARLLTPADFGTVAMLGLFLAIASSFVDSGFSTALIRKPDRCEDDFSTMFWFNVVASLLLYLMLFGAAPFIATFFNESVLCPILRVSALNMFIGSFAAVQKARLTIDVDFKTQAKASVASTVMSGIMGVVMAWQGFGVWSLVWSSVAGCTINTAVLWSYSHWYPKFRFSKLSFTSMFVFGYKLMLSGLLQTFYSQITTLLIGKFYTAEALGVYNRGAGFPQLASSNLINVLHRVTFPILSNIQKDETRLINVYRKYIKTTSLLIFFFMFLFAALAKPVITLLLTEKWSAAIPYAQVFCFVMMFEHVCVINLNLLQVKGRSDLFLRLELIKKTIAIGLLLAAVPFGVMVVCLSKLVYTPIAVFINTHYTGKLFNLGFIMQVRDFIPYIGYSVISCMPAYLITFLGIPAIISITTGALLAIGIYWGLLLIAHDETYQELLSILRKKKESNH